MRGLSFYAHAVGTAAFPGLVLADGLGFSAPLGAFAAALVFAFGVERLARQPARRLRQPHGARARGGAGRRRRPRQRRLPLGRQRRLAALRQPAADGHARSRARRRRQRRGRRRDAWCSGRAGSRGASTRPRRARSACARSAPDAVLLVLVAFAVVASLTAIGALLATALFVVPAATVRLWTQRLGVWQLGSVALAAAEGIAGLWLSVELNTPPGPTIAVLGGALFALSLRVAARRRRPGAGARRSPAPAALLALLLAGCGGGCARRALGPGRRRDDDADRRLGARGRRATPPACTRSCSRTPIPHEYEPRPADVEAMAGAKVVFENGDGLDTWMGTRDLQRGRLADGRRPRRASCRCACRARARAPRRRATTRTGGTTRATPRPPSRAIRDALVAANPAAAATYRANAAAYLRRLRALDAGIRACFAARARGAAQARLRPRRVRLLRAALRHHGRRRRDPVADDAGAALGRRHRRARAADPPRARARGLPGELAQPEARAADRARDRRARRLHALRRHARPERLARRDLPRDGGRRTPTRWCAASRAARAAAGSPGSHDARRGRRPRARLRRPARARGRDVQRRAGPAARRARPERRRQVDALPRAARRARAARGPARAARRAAASCRRPSARGSTTR